MGRTFDYEFSYGEEIVVTPRKYVFDFRHTDKLTTHYAMIGALEHGMDVKTLSAIIGHISSATTIDIYSHINGAMQRQAAQKIERGIGHSEAYEPHETLDDQLFPPKAENRL